MNFTDVGVDSKQSLGRRLKPHAWPHGSDILFLIRSLAPGKWDLRIALPSNPCVRGHMYMPHGQVDRDA